MKINSVYISAFGKFTDKRFDFTDGMNLIYGENEDGKTTLMSFIKMMFYGSSAKSNEELIKNPRKKYAPRNDKPMAGSIDFECGNKRYRIERIFKTSNSTDKISVTDLGSGERETFTGKEDLGKRFLGLSLDAAERCIFLSDHSNSYKNGGGEGELNTRLSNLAGTGNEEVSAEAVLSRIEKSKTVLITKTGRGGKISKDTEQLTELKAMLERAKRTEADRKECDLRLSNLHSHLKDVQTEIDRLTAHIKSAEGGKRYTKLKDYCDACTALDSINKKLSRADDEEITVAEISEAEAALQELKLLSQRLPELEEKHAAVKEQTDKLKEKLCPGESYEEISNRLSQKQAEHQNLAKEINTLNSDAEELSKKAMEAENQRKKIRPVFPVIALLGIAILALSFIKTPYKDILLICGGAVTLLGIILTFALRKKSKVSPKELRFMEADCRKSAAEKREVYNALSNEISTLTAAAAVAREKEISAGEAFTQKMEELNTLNGELGKIYARLDSIKLQLSRLITTAKTEFSPKGMEIILYSHKTNLQKKENLEVKIAMLKKDLNDISFDDAQNELSAIPAGAISVGDLDDLNERLIFKKKELEGLRQAIADDTAAAKNDFRFAVHPSAIERQIAELETQIAKEYYYSSALDIAYDTLNDAASKVRETFGAALGERTGEIFAGLTDGKYSAVSVSKSFNITVEEADVFGSNDWQSLSDGTIDQAYFALRLTVSELLSGDGERLPLILDDPFDRYDDKRGEKAMAFLEEYSKDSQSIIFTCHNSFTKNRSYMTLK